MLQLALLIAACQHFLIGNTDNTHALRDLEVQGTRRCGKNARCSMDDFVGGDKPQEVRISSQSAAHTTGELARFAPGLP